MRATRETNDYSVFGLRVRSEIELPELIAATWHGEPDVGILVEPGEQVRSDQIRAADGAIHVAITGVARFQVSRGAQIIVRPDPGTDARTVRLFLLGSAFGALLHQRQLLPLHANAVEIGGKAFAFMGRSGAGKSTLAAWFHDQGYPILADDVCVIGFDSGGLPRAYPGLPRLRLWLDALESSGRTTDGLSRSYAGSSTGPEKYDLPVEEASMVKSDLPVGALYVLEQGDKFEIEPLTGMAAGDAIIGNTYRGGYVAAANSQRQHWQSAVDLARVTPVFRLCRSKRFDRLADEGKRLLDHVRSRADSKSAD